MGKQTVLSFAALAAAFTATVPAVLPEIAVAQELDAYLQCVPYAREVSGIQIYGDAHTWWGQADGRYERGRSPKVGAVMYFPRTSRMRFGHVAAVSRLLDSRRVLLDHANWSPIDGRRGQIERDVLAVDVSDNNDWSQVRVWYAPLGDLGTTPWQVAGFIYPDHANSQRRTVIARAEPVALRAMRPRRTESSREFTSAFSNLGQPTHAVRQAHRATPAPRQASHQPRTTTATASALSRYDE